MSDKERWLIVKSDDGTAVYLSSYSGGASPHGILGQLRLMRENADGSTDFREYNAVSDWQPSDLQKRINSK